MSNGKNTLAPENKKPRKNSFSRLTGVLSNLVSSKPKPFKDLPEKESELKNFIQRFNDQGIILEISESNQRPIDKETEKLSTANDEQKQQIKEKIYSYKVNSFLTLPISVKLRWAIDPKSMSKEEASRQKRLLSDQIIDLLCEKKAIEEVKYDKIKKNQKVIDTFYKIHEKLIGEDKFLGTDYMAKFIAEKLSEQLSKQSEPFFDRLFKGEEITDKEIDDEIDDFVEKFSINAENKISAHSKNFQAILFSDENMIYLRRLRATEMSEFNKDELNKGVTFKSSNNALFEYYKKVYSSNKGTESKGGKRRGSDTSIQAGKPDLDRQRSQSDPNLNLPIPPQREIWPPLSELIAQSMEQSKENNPRSQSAKEATETTQLHRPRSSSAPSRPFSVEVPEYHLLIQEASPKADEDNLQKPTLPPKKENKGQGRGR